MDYFENPIRGILCKFLKISYTEFHGGITEGRRVLFNHKIKQRLIVKKGNQVVVFI